VKQKLASKAHALAKPGKWSTVDDVELLQASAGRSRKAELEFDSEDDSEDAHGLKRRHGRKSQAPIPVCRLLSGPPPRTKTEKSSRSSAKMKRAASRTKDIASFMKPASSQDSGKRDSSKEAHVQNDMSYSPNSRSSDDNADDDDSDDDDSDGDDDGNANADKPLLELVLSKNSKAKGRQKPAVRMQREPRLSLSNSDSSSDGIFDKEGSSDESDGAKPVIRDAFSMLGSKRKRSSKTSSMSGGNTMRRSRKQ